MLAQDFVISGYGVVARITYLWFQALGLWDLNDLDKRTAVFISLISILMYNREQIVAASVLSHAGLMKKKLQVPELFLSFRDM